VAATARRVLSAFQKPFLIDSYEINTTISFGIAIYPTKVVDACLKVFTEKGFGFEQGTISFIS